MIKRIMAWFLLVGFVLLLINLMVIHFYWIESLVVYVVIALMFIFMGFGKNKQGKRE